MQTGTIGLLPTTTAEPQQGMGGGQLATPGAKAAVGVGVVLGVALLAGLALLAACLLRRRRRAPARARTRGGAVRGKAVAVAGADHGSTSGEEAVAGDGDNQYELSEGIRRPPPTEQWEDHRGRRARYTHRCLLI